MALFGNNKDKEKKATKVQVKKTDAPKKAVAATPAKAPKKSKTSKTASAKKVSVATTEKVLIRPRITEKAAHLTAQNVYTFEVARNATKIMIKSAIATLYGVTPVKVAVLKTPGKKVRLRTRRGYGTKSGTKKAYVYLKEGDRIDFSA